jgi:hypothetical protein
MNNANFSKLSHLFLSNIHRGRLLHLFEFYYYHDIDPVQAWLYVIDHIHTRTSLYDFELNPGHLT